MIAGASSITAAANLTGHPALTIPVGFCGPMPEDIQSKHDNDIKLPVGLMMMGKYWDESMLYRVAGALETTGDWRNIVA